MFKLHREKINLIAPNINKAFKMQYDVFVKCGDCYKVAPTNSPSFGENFKPSLPGRVWVGLAFQFSIKTIQHGQNFVSLTNQ
jgi:hypothetical protein